MDRALRALDEMQVSGPGLHTTVPFHRQVLQHPVFRAGDATTDFLTRHLSAAA
jgi:acetyl-CoA carboxylase biotin carboxylase subunit